MVRYFTLPEAERLLPRVERCLREALSHRSDALKANEELEAASARIRMAGGVRVNPGSLLATRARRDVSEAAMKEALEQIEQTGAVVKDLDLGLIDFMSRFQDRDVCLCWKLGEKGIAFWHGADEGFRGRKPIDREFIDGHSCNKSPGGSPERVN
jgi:hypothetical protein